MFLGVCIVVVMWMWMLLKQKCVDIVFLRCAWWGIYLPLSLCIYEVVVFCFVSFWLNVGVELVVFIVECVVVVVMVDNGWETVNNMVDNGWETVNNMVDVVVYVECWHLVWWVGGPSISLSVMEYGLVVSKSSSRSRSRSGPRSSTSDSPQINEIVLSSRILLSSSLLIWISIWVNHCVPSVRMANGVFMCV